jgi:hypothetical protein
MHDEIGGVCRGRSDSVGGGFAAELGELWYHFRSVSATENRGMMPVTSLELGLPASISVHEHSDTVWNVELDLAKGVSNEDRSSVRRSRYFLVVTAEIAISSLKG